MLQIQNTQAVSTPDVYFTSGYGIADANFVNGTWISLSNEDGSWQMPLVITELGHGLREAASPYGYSGICITTSSPTSVNQAWDESREMLREMSVVSLFLRFSPLDTASFSAAKSLYGLNTTASGTTYAADTRDIDHAWSSMEGRARTAVRKARQNNLVSSVRPADETDLMQGSAFRTLYGETMLRVDASGRYFFDDTYYLALVRSLADSLLIAEVRLGDQIVSSALVMRHGNIAHYHLSGSDSAGAKLGSNALLIWSILEWCSDSGVRRFHLGGGVGHGDGLSRFKRSFGGEQLQFHTGQHVLDPEAYQDLTAKHAAERGIPMEQLQQSNYFPAFRA